MFDEDPAAEGGEEVGIDNARSPAPDAAPEDDPAPDALAGDVEIKSGTGDPSSRTPSRRARQAPPRASPPRPAAADPGCSPKQARRGRPVAAALP